MESVDDDKKIGAIFNNAADFLNTGIEILFSKKLDARYAKVALLSVQTAIELLAKYRLASDGGLEAIRLQTKNSHKFKTKTYADVIKEIGKGYDEFGDYEQEVFFMAAELRNNLVHLSASVEPASIKATCMALLSAALPLFAMGPRRDDNEMTDYRWFLSDKNYHRLTNDGLYRTEALDNAVVSANAYSGIVEHCHNCQCESLVLRESESYFCYCCGFSIFSDTLGFCECSDCGKRRVVYDALNEQSGITINDFDGLSYSDVGGLFYGRCFSCDEVRWVSYCPECKTTSTQSGSRPLKPCYHCGCEQTG